MIPRKNIFMFFMNGINNSSDKTKYKFFLTLDTLNTYFGFKYLLT